MGQGFGPFGITPVAGHTLLADAMHLPDQLFTALGEMLPAALVWIDDDKQLARPGSLGAGMFRPVELEGKIAPGQGRGQ